MLGSLKNESYKKGVVLSTALNILAKGIVFLNTLVIAYFFGATAETDIYFYILSVALLITTAINGMDYLVIIPQFMKIKEQQSDTAAQEFANFFIYLYFFIGLTFALLAATSPVLFYNFFSKFDNAVLNKNLNLLYIGCSIILFQLVNNLLTAILVSRKFFSVAIISGLVNSIFSILFTFSFHKKWGVAGTMCGIATGYCINFLLLIFLMKRYVSWNFKAVKWMKDLTVWKNAALIQINTLPVWIRNYIVLFFMTGLGTGVITSFNLAQIIAALPEVFVLTQVASIAGIKFSELYATGKYEETKILFSNLINTLFIIILPLAVIMIVANKEIVQLVFERGNFNKSSVEITAFCFFYMALLLPAKITDVLFSRLFTSFQRYNVSIVFATVGHTVITLLVYYLFLRFKLYGYFTALLIGNYLILPLIFLLINRSGFSLVNIKKIYKDIFLLFIVSIATYFIAYWLVNLLPYNTYLRLFCSCVVVFAVFFAGVAKTVNCTFQLQLVKSLFKKFTSK